MKPKYHDMFDFQTKNGWKSEAETGKHECCQSRVLPDTEQMGFKCQTCNVLHIHWPHMTRPNGSIPMVGSGMIPHNWPQETMIQIHTNAASSTFYTDTAVLTGRKGLWKQQKYAMDNITRKASNCTVLCMIVISALWKWSRYAQQCCFNESDQGFRASSVHRKWWWQQKKYSERNIPGVCDEWRDHRGQFVQLMQLAFLLRQIPSNYLKGNEHCPLQWR